MNVSALSKSEFNAVIYFTNFKQLPGKIQNAPNYPRISLNAERLLVFIYPDVPYIRIFLNKSAYELLHIGTPDASKAKLIQHDDNRWEIYFYHTYAIFFEEIMFHNTQKAKKYICTQYFDVSWPAIADVDNYILKSSPIRYISPYDFLGAFNDAAVKVVLKSKTAIAQIHWPTLCLDDEHLVVNFHVSTNWKIIMHDKLYDMLNINKHVWYEKVVNEEKISEMHLY